jgi:hypothetical protein
VLPGLSYGGNSLAARLGYYADPDVRNPGLILATDPDHTVDKENTGMSIERTEKNGQQGWKVVNSGHKLFAAYGVGSKRRALAYMANAKS